MMFPASVCVFLLLCIFDMMSCKVLTEKPTHKIQTAVTGGPLSTHILDTTVGRPAASVPITVHSFCNDSGLWFKLAECTTDTDGRCNDLLTDDQFSAGTYKLTFNTGEYFKRQSTNTFYPFVEVVFQVDNTTEHYHVPLLLNPFGYSTYRGS